MVRKNGGNLSAPSSSKMLASRGIPLRHTRERKENKLNSPTSFSKVIFQNKGWKKSPHVYFNKPYIDLILLYHVHLTGHFVHLALGTPKA